ncbi:dihydrodipicolinate synthase [Xylella fastidiosa 32]|nr:dihydroxydipicolinate synthase [Xylella fastidiosa 9a5c]ETE30471.1 dihydrodipicolinate synthase [Xylella fastidiosa 32]
MYFKAVVLINFKSITVLSLSGIITALVTPFDRDGAFDRDAWIRLLDLQLAGGVQGVVIAGSTGEAATLTDAEYDEMLCSAVVRVGGRVPVLAGTGLSGTAKTISQTKRAADNGAGYALVVTPPYIRPNQGGLKAHYLAVADQGGLPVVLYNVPSRTGCDLLPETVADLAGHPNIVGIKEACASRERVQALLALRRPGFTVFSGDDSSAARSMLDGADGLVSVASNVLPSAYRHLCDLARAGERGAIDLWNARLSDFHAFCGLDSNPIPIKALLQRIGIGYGLRLPLLPLSVCHHDIADHLADQVAALEALSSRKIVAA